jgi:hypothetical protein
MVDSMRLRDTEGSRAKSTVRGNPNYLDKAGWFQKVLSKTRGLDLAADIVEWASGEPMEVKAKEAVAAHSFSRQDNKWKNI